MRLGTQANLFEFLLAVLALIEHKTDFGAVKVLESHMACEVHQMKFSLQHCGHQESFQIITKTNAKDLNNLKFDRNILHRIWKCVKNDLHPKTEKLHYLKQVRNTNEANEIRTKNILEQKLHVTFWPLIWYCNESIVHSSVYQITTKMVKIQPKTSNHISMIMVS